MIAGRSSPKTIAWSLELNEQFPNRSTPMTIDISSQLSLETAPHFDVLVNFASAIKADGEDATDLIRVIKFANSRNAHYIDADATVTSYTGYLERIQDAVGTVGPVALIASGVEPGSAGPLMRAAFARIPNCTELYSELITNQPPQDGVAGDFFVLGYQPLPGGYWNDTTLEGLEPKQIDFGDGKQWEGVPHTSAEVLAIKAELGVPICGTVGCGDPKAGPPMFTFRGMLLEVFGRTFLGRWFPKFFEKVIKMYLAMDYEKGPKYTILQGRAIRNDKVAKSKQFMVRARCEDTNSDDITSMAVLATVEQILDGTIKGNKPVGLAGAVADGNKFLESLKRQGCSITEHWG